MRRMKRLYGAQEGCPGPEPRTARLHHGVVSSILGQVVGDVKREGTGAHSVWRPWLSTLDAVGSSGCILPTLV